MGAQIGTDGRFERGDPITIRHVVRGSVFSALPAFSVEDSPERVVYFVPRGTKWYVPVDDAGRRVGPAAPAWSLRVATWDPYDTLWVTPGGAAYGVVLRWLPAPEGRRFDGWYVNLQDPLRRSPLGFDSMDHELDLVIAADGRWWWKDEDKLRDAASALRADPGFAVAVKMEGRAVLRRFLHNEPPFGEGWERWIPDPSWKLPPLLPADVVGETPEEEDS